MSWLDAHQSYIMETIVRDRVDDLRSTVDLAAARTERTTAPTAPVPDPRHTAPTDAGLGPCVLAKASR
jgi:hypothetical protein